MSTSRDWALFKKEYPTSVTMAKLEESTALPSMLLASLYTNKGKILAKRSNVPIKHIKHAKSRIAS